MKKIILVLTICLSFAFILDLKLRPAHAYVHYYGSGGLWGSYGGGYLYGPGNYGGWWWKSPAGRWWVSPR